MKKNNLLLSALFIVFLSTVKSQMVYFTYGYNGAFTNLSGINSVVDNYNTTRSWLDSKMGKFNYLDGLNINIGFGISSMWMEVGYDFRGQKKTAFGTDSKGDFNTRELKIKNNSPQFTLGLLVNVGNRSALGIGCRMEFGSVKAKTRVFGVSEDKDKFENLNVRYSGTRIGPTIKLLTNRGNSGFTITGSVFYLWNLQATQENAWDLDEKINNTEYSGDYPSKFNLKTNSFGIALTFGLAGSG